MQSEKSKKPKLWLTSMFLCFAICFDLIALLTPDTDFSETENRMLAQAPKITVNGLSDGSFGQDVEKYLSDQFAYRDVWSSMSFFTRNSIFRQSEINGVYIGSDGYLMLAPSKPDERAMNEKISAINAAAGRHSDVNQVISVIPNAVTVMSGKLPLFAPISPQPGQLDRLSHSLHITKFCDVSDALIRHNDEELYYHTDHHWTSRGAYLAFTEIAPYLNIDPNKVNFKIYTVSESFEGTLASKSGSRHYKDRIEIYVPVSDTPISVTCSDRDETRGTLYEREFLDTKDKYALFLGGNHPVVTVRTTNDTQRSLLLIKDSYANCFVQFLTPYFDQIIIVDPRYTYESIDAMITQNDITDVLYLYNADTFMTDTSLTDFLALESSDSEEES